MSDLCDRLRRIGDAGSTESRVALEAVREIERLKVILQEAREMVNDWAGYASDYFQEKWDLDGDLAKLDAAIAE